MFLNKYLRLKETLQSRNTLQKTNKISCVDGFSSFNSLHGHKTGCVTSKTMAGSLKV